jgi:3-oxoacyl-[acyl-carrier protein] reductase
MTDTSSSGSARPVAIVSGGSRGIGKAIVLRLARAGVDVRFTYLNNEQAASAVVDELRAQGFSAAAARVDSRDIAASAELVDKTITEAGRLDVLVNNAGVTADKLLPMMSDAEWSNVLATSLNGLFGASRPAAAHMMRNRRGRIINLTSVSGVSGIPGQTKNCAAKSAIIGFTRALSKEMAPWGVCVNAVAPGFIDTDMLAGFTAAQKTANIARVPMRRYGNVDEVANLVGYLALEAPGYLTGQTIVLDGGLTG